MKVLELRRFLETGNATFGYIDLDGRIFWTIEPLWYGNRKAENGLQGSRIPEGCYQYQVNERGVYEAVNTRPRTDIQIHTGNWSKDTDGCQIIGSGVKYLNGELAVEKSTQAYNKFMEVMQGETFLLDITDNFS